MTVIELIRSLERWPNDLKVLVYDEDLKEHLEVKGTFRNQNSGGIHPIAVIITTERN